MSGTIFNLEFDMISYREREREGEGDREGGRGEFSSVRRLCDKYSILEYQRVMSLTTAFKNGHTELRIVVHRATSHFPPTAISGI